MPPDAFHCCSFLSPAATQAANAQTAAEARYVGVWDAVARILGAEGLSGFFKGEKLLCVGFLWFLLV